MSYINTIPPDLASGEVRRMYQRQARKPGYVPNYARVFCHRPDVMDRWGDLLNGIRRHVEPRRFELVTLAAAHALRNSYCSLAHGKALTEFYPADAIAAVLAGRDDGPLTAPEAAMMTFARKVATDAVSVSKQDVAALKAHGLTDADVFDVVAIVAARAFFTRILDGLGAVPDAAYQKMDASLRDCLEVGRAVEPHPVEPIGSGQQPECQAHSTTSTTGVAEPETY